MWTCWKRSHRSSHLAVIELLLTIECLYDCCIWRSAPNQSITSTSILQLECNENKYFDLNKQTTLDFLIRPEVGAKPFENNLFIYLLLADVLLLINHRRHHIRLLSGHSCIANEKFVWPSRIILPCALCMCQVGDDGKFKIHLPVALLKRPAFLKYVNSSPPTTYSNSMYRQLSVFVCQILSSKK